MSHSETRDRPFRHLCPEADERDAMDDNEFWNYVFNRDERPDAPEADWDDMEPTDEELRRPPCEVCGSIGACGYDTEGLPLIHAIAPDDES